MPTPTPPNPLVRRATVEDAGEILTLQRAAWITEAQLHDSAFLPPLTQTYESVLDDLRTHTALVAVLDQPRHRIAGTIRARLTGTTWHIGRLGVVPDLQRRRIGQGLLSAIEAAAPAEADRFELFTGPKSVDNIAFYERRGYLRLPAHVDDDLIHLAKTIDREPQP